MPLTEQEKKILQHLRNWKVHTGDVPSYRKLMNLLGYKSPRSISVILQSLVDKGYIQRFDDNQIQILEQVPEERVNSQTIDVPIVGNIACGEPIFATEHIENYVTVSTSMARPPYEYFILRATGDSMNLKNIYNDTLVLVRKQDTARTGDVVVAIINDECTLKEFKMKDSYILLIPHSDNPTHKPIVLTQEFRVQGVVVAILPNLH